MFSPFNYVLLAFCMSILARAIPTFPSTESISEVKRDDNLPARVSYVFPPPGTDELADEIRSRRPNGVLLDLDGVLLQQHALAQGWNAFFTVIRNGNSIPADMRELLILRTAVLNKVAYQWIQHEPEGYAAGLTTEQLKAIRFTPAYKTPKGLSPELKAAFAFADSITLNVRVPDRVFNGLARYLNESQMVEATATAGSYNFVGRFLTALDIDGKMDEEVPIPEED